MVKLTEYSHGAGCGCKISPALLEEILKTDKSETFFPQLLVGNSSKDDAAAFDLGNGTSVLSTTDFFMPIVDDPFTFGKIAATNSLSDVYAMGGKPLMAISIFGWPIDKLSEKIARQVIDGGRAVCAAAGIPLAGGHSIDSPEPIFGLAATGLVDNKNLKRNDQATEDCELFLTKPLGIGILTTAQKQKKLQEGELDPAIEAMCTLNTPGTEIAKLEAVTAMTDVTGFGLMGHLSEICEGSNISATVNFSKIPLLPKIKDFLAAGCIPGGTRRNFASYGHNLGEMSQQQQDILCDPQTSGGLLIAVKKSGIREFMDLASSLNLNLDSIGNTHKQGEKLVNVINE